MPKVTEAHRAARRSEILDAALRCFARDGYQRTSMADIIGEAGLSAGAIYGYFDSKQAIVRAVATQVFEARRAELQSRGAAEPLSPADVVLTLLEGVQRNVPMRVLIQMWSEATVDEELQRMLVGSLTQMRSTLAAELARWARAHPDAASGDPEAWGTALAPVLMSLIPGYALQRTLVPDFDATAYAQALSLALPHD